MSDTLFRFFWTGTTAVSLHQTSVLSESRDKTLSTPDEVLNQELFLPRVDTTLGSITARFSKMEDIYY